jgi:hypothetical protein
MPPAFASTFLSKTYGKGEIKCRKRRKTFSQDF